MLRCRRRVPHPPRSSRHPHLDRRWRRPRALQTSRPVRRAAVGRAAALASGRRLGGAGERIAREHARRGERRHVGGASAACRPPRPTRLRCSEHARRPSTTSSANPPAATLTWPRSRSRQPRRRAAPSKGARGPHGRRQPSPDHPARRPRPGRRRAAPAGAAAPRPPAPRPGRPSARPAARPPTEAATACPRPARPASSTPRPRARRWPGRARSRLAPPRADASTWARSRARRVGTRTRTDDPAAALRLPSTPARIEAGQRAARRRPADRPAQHRARAGPGRLLAAVERPAGQRTPASAGEHQHQHGQQDHHLDARLCTLSTIGPYMRPPYGRRPSRD